MTNVPLGIVIVNYKGVGDVLECLESVFRSAWPVRVVVVDNDSGDGSSDAIEAWARGERDAPEPSPALAHLSRPPVVKPVACVRLAEGDTQPRADIALTIIDARRNGGFASGNNVGLRHLLADPKLDYFWLLNPDTVVEPTAAGALVQQMAAIHRVGMCGTQVRFYHRPGHTQALNGQRFSTWTGQSRGISADAPVGVPYDPAVVARQTDYVLGASLAVSRPFLTTIGLMEEGYFLYFEEIDWAFRNAGRFATGFAHAAVIFHKEGGSIGSSSRKGGRSALSEYYLLRSRHAFVRRFRPWLLPVHFGLSLALIARRRLRGRGAQAAAMLRALTGRAY